MKTLALLAILAMTGCTVTVPDLPQIDQAPTNAPALPIVTPVVVTPDTGAVAMLPKPATLCAPTKGKECMNPFGKDIRGLAYSGGKRIFIGCDEWVKSLSFDGKTVKAGHEWTKDGVRYVLDGCNAPSSSGPVLRQDSIAYRKTTRFYYWPTREVQP
jgi:hypothetical protein